MRATLLLLLAFIALASSITTEEREAKKKTIRMKSKHALTYTAARLFSHVRRSTLAASRQLKEIFEEMGYPYKHMTKEEMQKVAYKEDIVSKWEEKHPEKKRKPAKGKPTPGFDDFGGGGFGGDPRMEDLMRQMRGDFSGEKDPEKRRILEKLAKKGMSFGGGNDMDLEQLKNMEKMMDGINMGKMGDDMPGGGGDAKPGGGDGDEVRDESEMEEVDDKMEL